MRSWCAAVALVVAGAGFAPAAALARPPVAAEAADATVALQALPVEAQVTHRRILNGGPFPYAKDGVVFFNRERQLPRRARGQYREYTVATPGAHDRGARRIVCGGAVAVRPDACFYTDNHYASFRRIVQ